MSGDDARIALTARITGRVQGVAFRYWTRGEATALGLSGWVRNEADGSVEALFAGDPAAVAEMVGRCHSGPPAARVDGVETTPVAPVPPEGAAAAGFQITR